MAVEDAGDALAAVAVEGFEDGVVGFGESRDVIWAFTQRDGCAEFGHVEEPGFVGGELDALGSVEDRAVAEG